MCEECNREFNEVLRAMDPKKGKRGSRPEKGAQLSWLKEDVLHEPRKRTLEEIMASRHGPPRGAAPPLPPPAPVAAGPRAEPVMAVPKTGYELGLQGEKYGDATTPLLPGGVSPIASSARAPAAEPTQVKPRPSAAAKRARPAPTEREAAAQALAVERANAFHLLLGEGAWAWVRALAFVGACGTLVAAGLIHP